MASSIRRGAADRRSENSPINAAGPSTTAEAPPKDNMISLAALNPYITCPICNGYFVDATTVIDCLHTFCKSCLLKYFEDNTDCPKCHNQIHQSHPSHYVAFDRTMQDIVYKLVPGMQAEEQRRREMFKQRQQRAKEVRGEQNGGGQANGAGASSSGSDSGFSNSSIEDAAIGGRGGGAGAQENCTNKASEHGRECCSAQQDPTTAHRRGDEQVLIQLLPDDKLGPIERSLVRLSVFATVNTVKRLLAYLLFNDITKYSEFDIFCNQELMGRDFSMAFIKKTRWRNKPEPVILMYKERIDF